MVEVDISILAGCFAGSDEERGMTTWREQSAAGRRRQEGSDELEESAQTTDTYDIPVITPILRRWRWTRYVPFLPTFDEGMCSLGRKTKKKTKKMKKKKNKGRQNNRARDSDEDREQTV